MRHFCALRSDVLACWWFDKPRLGIQLMSCGSSAGSTADCYHLKEIYDLERTQQNVNTGDLISHSGAPGAAAQLGCRGAHTLSPVSHPDVALDVQQQAESRWSVSALPSHCLSYQQRRRTALNKSPSFHRCEMEMWKSRIVWLLPFIHERVDIFTCRYMQANRTWYNMNVAWLTWCVRQQLAWQTTNTWHDTTLHDSQHTITFS